MDFLLGVAIEDTRVAWVADSGSRKQSSILLTTVADDQRRASIKFYIKKDGKTELLCTETVTGIPAAAAGEPAINTELFIEGRFLRYVIKLDGVLKAEKTVRLPVRSGILPAVIAGAAAAAAAAAVLLVLLLPADSAPENVKTGTGFPSSAEKNTSSPAAPSVPEKKQTAAALPGTAAQIMPLPEKENPAAGKTGFSGQATAPFSAGDQPGTESTAGPAAEDNGADLHEDESNGIPDGFPEPEFTYTEVDILEKLVVYFLPDSPLLTSDTRKALDRLAAGLPVRKDYESGSFEVAIEGHCAKYGSEEGRRELSVERAKNVQSYLFRLWDVEARLDLAGYGAERPVTEKRDEQHLNRRVEIRIEGRTLVKQ